MTDIMVENRRWTILRLLAGDNGHVVPARLIQRGLGHVNRAHANVSLDQIRKDLRWLDARMLIELDIQDDDTYAKLLQRGLDVAEGRTVVEGVDEPPLSD
ncbi:MAG: hypothetical protein RH946_00700 [Rhodospirillales bacterium]